MLTASQMSSAAAEQAQVSAPTESLTLRVWFACYVLWLVALAGGAMFGLHGWRGGQGGELGVWAVCLGVFYLSVSNTLLPLPTSWVVMFLASDMIGLPGGVLGRIVIVASAGAVATGMANLNEYHVLRWMLRSKLARRIRRTRAVRWGIRWFRVSPFTILSVAAFVPIPVDAVRWLAIADGYSRWRYFWAYFTGRWVRYALLAAGTVWTAAGPGTIAAVQIVLVVIAAGHVGWRAARRS